MATAVNGVTINGAPKVFNLITHQVPAARAAREQFIDGSLAISLRWLPSSPMKGRQPRRRRHDPRLAANEKGS